MLLFAGLSVSPSKKEFCLSLFRTGKRGNEPNPVTLEHLTASRKVAIECNLPLCDGA